MCAIEEHIIIIIIIGSVNEDINADAIANIIKSV